MSTIFVCINAVITSFLAKILPSSNMGTLKIFVLCLILISVQSRHIHIRPSIDSDDVIILNGDQAVVLVDGEVVHPATQLRRITRDVHGSLSTNQGADGSLNVLGKVPLAGNDKNELSAIGVLSGLKPGDYGYGSATGGLALDNVNGHSLSLTGSHIPSFGDQLTASGKVNLFENDNHKLEGTTFYSRNMPSYSENLPSFNTYGGGLDYTYKDKIGGSLSAAHTDLFDKTDVTALGRLNLHRDTDSSLDFSAGASRSFSPYIPKSSWEPQIGLTFTKHW